MSWFIGGIGKGAEKEPAIITRIKNNSLAEFRTDDFFLFAGGNNKTCFYKFDESSSVKWLVVGLGIGLSPGKFLDKDDWKKLIEKGEVQDLDGHYILLRWDENKINFFTDPVGLRDFYYCKDEQGNIFFSTRADWLAQIISTEINFREFGSRWLLHNQISHNSVLRNINRIVGGSRLTIDFKKKLIHEDKRNWLPAAANAELDENDFYKALHQLSTFPLSTNKLTLSLSGGLDSRLLFSILTGEENKDWYAHSFGNANHPDSKIAKEISRDAGVAHQQIDLSISQADVFMNELQEYSCQTMVNNSASLFLQQRNYNWFAGKDEVLIDGGFGEIWRRQFNNRIALTGRDIILKRKHREIIPLISYRRADVFNEEIQKEMTEGCIEQLKWLYEVLPDPEKVGIENWLDLYSTKTRLPNCYLHEQTRIDSIIQCYTPFVQLSIMKNLLGLNSSKKKNGKLFRKLIQINNDQLKKYPLVKGNYMYPFWMTPLQSKIWSVFKEKVGSKSQPNLYADLIFSMKNILADYISAQNVRECGLYNLHKLDNFKEALEKNNYESSLMNELDWWISFELFHQGIKIG